MTLQSTTNTATDEGNSGMEDVNIEDLLNFEGDDDGDNDDDDDDEAEDDPDFLELQQKLTGESGAKYNDDDNNNGGGGGGDASNNTAHTTSPETAAAAAAAAAASAAEVEVTLSPEEQVRKLQDENAQLQQQLQEMQLANDTVDPNAPSTDDLLEQISDLETQVARLQEQKQTLANPTSAGVSTLLQRIQALETMNRRLEDGNSQLQMQVQELQQQNEHHLETIEKLKNQTAHETAPPTPVEDQNDAKKKDDPVIINSAKPKPELPQSSAWQYAGQVAQIRELEGTVQNLQERIMALVEEKLELKLSMDRMEHDLKQYQQFAPKGGSWFSPTLKAAPSVEDTSHDNNNDDNDGENNNPSPASQTDFLKQALASKKKRESARFGGFLGTSSSGDDHKDSSGTKNKFQQNMEGEDDEDIIDVEMYKKLVEHQARYGAASLGIKSSHDDFDKVVNQFESKSSWKHNNGSTPPSKSSTSSTIAGFTSFFASKSPDVEEEEEDSQFTSSPIRHDRVTTRIPPPMAMDTLPSMLGLALGSRKGSREDYLDDETIEFGSSSNNSNNNKTSSSSKEQEKATLFPPLAEVNKAWAAHKSATVTKTHKENPVGLGKTIDQSNLLGHYVAKKKENPFNYLTSMIYGSDDADPDDADADDVLREELSKKRKDDLTAKESSSSGFAPYRDQPITAYSERPSAATSTTATKDKSLQNAEGGDDDVLDTIDVELYKKLAEHQARYGAESLGLP